VASYFMRRLLDFSGRPETRVKAAWREEPFLKLVLFRVGAGCRYTQGQRNLEISRSVK